MRDIYICQAYRTPIGITGGCLSTYNAETLGSMLLKNMILRTVLKPSDIDMIILGNAVGHGGNIARLVALTAFGHQAPPAMTLDHQCGSGMAAIVTACDFIRMGRGEIAIAGGVESTSTQPHKFLHENDSKAKYYPKPLKRAPFSSRDVGDPEMIEGAENTARLFGATREMLDEIAFESHQSALRANDLKRFIIPIKDQKNLVEKDEGLRPKMSMRLLKRLPGLLGGESVTTTGNACLTHDGASFLMLASYDAMIKHHLKPIGKVINDQYIAINPNYSPLGALVALQAIEKKLEKIIDVIEVNEAFAVKTWLLKKYGYDSSIINPMGGALAYGHPYGASGAIIVTHALASLLPGQVGVATMGIAGGQGIAIAVERV